ncbi:glycosyltransferase WbuB [Halopseudomonas salina]|uniref:Colanic acid biosynthesis glycosyltransferase WcaI n=1 Tax=Halopseudomonas salina TaxID=1323744 RepID=A0ABQ1PHN3_9GAMM|nr:glycosyltransferase WbuB [Halopseudomonas salina]GGC97300.1 colanic acid biosynthesis glycosyltransferase WcaI [Halopseudomonas salina]
MNIVLYGINYSPELTGIGKYSGEMGEWLQRSGHQVSVITAPPYYPEWRVKEGFTGSRWHQADENGVRVTRCPLYVPREVNSLKRLLHLSSFALSSLFPLIAQLRNKPDLVILVAPTLFCAPGAWLLSKLSGATSVLHIQDYEVDALFGLGLAKPGILKRFAYATERFLLRRFDYLSTISSGMLKRAKEKGVPENRLVFFPNWSETHRFKDIRPCPDLLRKLGVPDGRRVLLYSGNMGDKQGLEQLIDAAERLQGNEDMFFLLVGEGSGKQRLLEKAKGLQLANVAFAPLQPYEDLPVLLASADVHLVVQKRGAADAVLPSKLTNILAVGGNAVITADSDTTLGLLCLDHPGIAVCIEPESVDALLTGINQAMKMPARNAIAQSYASEYLDKESILQRFIEEVSSDVAAR